MALDAWSEMQRCRTAAHTPAYDTSVPRTYGGTDAVWASQSGKPVVEDSGLPGGNCHSSVGEFALIDRIPRRLLLAAEMIRALSRF